MNGFEQLLEKVRKNNPNIITESEANAMLDDFNKANEQNITAAEAEGFKNGYDEGFANAKAQAETDLKAQLDELLAKCDDDATAKLQTIIKIFNDEKQQMIDDHASKLQNVYDTLTANTVPATDIQDMDEQHADMFQQAVDAIDESHAQKLCEAVDHIKTEARKYNAIREDFHNKKFKNYRTIMENKMNSLKKDLKNEQNRKLATLAESVDKYLNYALGEVIPKRKLVSEAKYNASQKAIEKIASILKINTILQESKDGIFKDYENKIAQAKADANKLMNENANLMDKLNKTEAKVMLESKLTTCTPAEAAYLRSYFNNAASSQIIEEQIEDAKASFKRVHDERRKAMVNNARAISRPSAVVNESKNVKPVNKEVKKQIVTEEKTNNKALSINEIYAQMLKR